MSAGGPKPSAFYVERQALTRSPTTPTAPTNRSSNFSGGQVDPGPGNPTPGDGIVLGNLMALVVSVYPQATHNITGGSLLCWIFNPYQAQWARCYELDYTITAGTYPALTFSALWNPSRLGMLVNWAFSGVTTDGGIQDALLRIDGFNSVLGMGT